MKTKLPKNPESEATLKWMLDNWTPNLWFTEFTETPGAIAICDESDKVLCVISLRRLIKRRAPLTGIKAAQKQVKKVLNSKGGRRK